jgi:hypothetical protein
LAVLSESHSPFRLRALPVEPPNLMDRRLDEVVVFTIGEGDVATTLAYPVSGLSRRENALEPRQL